MASTTHASLAEDAAAYLGRSSDSLQGFGSDPKEIDRQSACLIEWASKNNAVLSDSYTSGLERQEGTTAEHEVFYRSDDNRAVKRTYAGTFGVTCAKKGEQGHATPLFYFRRLQLMNREFNSDLRFEGIILTKSLILFATGEHPCMVISQPWHRPADPHDPHPSPDEIIEFMELLGFAEVKGSYFGWFKNQGKIKVIDARPDNFIKAETGVIPIDLVISEEP
jgi:hypothetical protein